ncbi:phosphate ABC transporter substrate-binding protein [Halobacteriovorax sp.]|uniref:phosphate ABC transporter substrate-binding protein n=1 Tax=Halobacteriovorax sp. TaxID=2020862 RepID=UPI003AF301AA
MKLMFCVLLVMSFNSFAKDSLIITGSSTIAPVISDLAKNYESKHSNTRIDVQTGGSSRGILDARKELAQIGMVSRSMKVSEGDLHHFTLAKDGLAIIVHKSNPIKELTEDQIKKIYHKEIKNWKSIGGNNKKIVVVHKAEGRSTLELFLKFFKLKNSEISPEVIIGDNEQGIKTVSKNPNAIAYVSIGAAEYNASIGVPLKLLKFKGIEAKVKNVENGSYPLMRELNLVTKSKPTALADNFIKYVLSKEASQTIKDHYFVPVNKK